MFRQNSNSSTSEYLKSIQSSHEHTLCQLYMDDIQQIHLMETNEKYELGQDYEAPFMTPSILTYLPWNWWCKDLDLMSNYKTEITFHGPDVYLCNAHNVPSPYPLLRPSNFDCIDFEHALRKMTIYLPQNPDDRNSNRSCRLMTDVVSEVICEELSNHNQTLHNMHNRNNNNNRRSYSMQQQQQQSQGVDDELLEDINRLHIKMSVSGTFISKPYDANSYNPNDKSFDVRCYFNWDLSCIESDCAYSVYILPSHPMNRMHGEEVYVNNYDQSNTDCKLRIFPQPDHQNQQKENNRKRKRNRSEIDSLSEIECLNNKRRKLNGCNEEKQEFEFKEDHRPIQRRFKQKTSNRKVHKLKNQNVSVERLGNRRISMTATKKSRKKKKKKKKEREDLKYRGYFIAIFVPRSAELYPFCTEQTNLQPFIRGHVVFYDAISADEDKPNKENYEWMIGQIMQTYKCKGRNLSEFKMMEFEAGQVEEYQAIERRNSYNESQRERQCQNQSTESIVFGGGGGGGSISSSKQEMDDENENDININDNQQNANDIDLTQQTSALSMETLRLQRSNDDNHNHNEHEPSSVSPQAGNVDTINLTI